ncbi:MAG: PBP1A family penicillin-binding protein, partial [Bacteroidetes bacterium]|nr:PBP1A family penicillin-binding protein [Bacteroidota bacterium]
MNKIKLKFWVIRLTAISAALTFILILFIGIFIYAVKNGKYGDLPDYTELRNVKNNEASEIYSADGVLLGKYYLVNRTNAEWEDISPNIINALIATEDVRFYQHQGIDKRSLARVLVKSLLLQKGGSGGGSTISQQLVKNLYGRKQYPYLSMAISKVKEAIIAHRLEHIYSKEEILTLYLNTVSFGENVYGIEVASERYFSTNPKNISVSEAAILVGMLKATTNYNPRAYPENALKRRNIVLSQMVKYEFLDTAIMDSLKKEPLNLKYNYITHNDGLAPYFRETIRLELHKWLKQNPKEDGTHYNLYTDGLKIHTTINSKLQEFAEEAVRNHMKVLQAQFFKHWKPAKTTDKLQGAVLQAKLRSPRYKELKENNISEEKIEKIFATPVSMKLFSWDGETEMKMSPLDSIRYYQHFLSAGFFAMEPETGKVLAWVGGVDYRYFKYDHIRSKRQVGSTFKPIVYAAALENGMEPCQYISNEKRTYENLENWSPRNADGKYDGYYTLQGGLMKSLNTVTTKIMLETGTEPVIKLARKMGISSNLPEVPSLALGTAAISLEEMVSAYTTFPNRGFKTHPVYIAKIEDANGNIIIDFTEKFEEKSKAMEESTADMINHFLKSAVDSGTAAGLRYKFGLKNEIGGKTGTTQNHADGWFIGYTPHLVAGVWVGHDDPKVHFNTPGLGQGSKMAMPIWANFMKKVLNSPEFEHQLKARFAPLSPELM